MKKIYTFNLNNDINTSSNNTFCAKSTDYSKTLDTIIASNIIDSNAYLKPYIDITDTDFIGSMMKDTAKKHTSIFSCTLKDDSFIKAANLIANYKKNKDLKSKFILGKTYKLLDGTPIIFYSDEIQIGLDLYSYDDLKNITFIKGLPSTTKSLFINIININL